MHLDHKHVRVRKMFNEKNVSIVDQTSGIDIILSEMNYNHRLHLEPWRTSVGERDTDLSASLFNSI
mgnify:CR=1 FL=1